MTKEKCSGIRLKNLLKASVKRLEFYAGNMAPAASLVQDLRINEDEYTSSLKKALEEASQSAMSAEYKHAGHVISEFSETLSKYARGNAGIILSLVFNAFAETIKNKAVFTCEDLASAFEKSLESIKAQSWQEQNNKLLDTVFSCYEAALNFLKIKCDLYEMLQNIHNVLKEQMRQRTPEEIVLDFINTGEWSLLGIIEGMLLYSQKKPFDDPLIEFSLNTSEKIKIALITGKYAVDVTITSGNTIDVEKIRKSISDLCEFMILIPQNENTLKVYLYTYDTKKVFDRISNYGNISSVKVADVAACGEQQINCFQN